MQGAALLGTSVLAASASAMGYGDRMHPPMPPMPPSPATMGMMPYDMPGGYAYGAPMAYGGYRQSSQTYGYGYAQPGESKRVQRTASPAADGEVRINQMRFEPAAVNVKAGETVTWRNDANMPHTVSARGEGGPKSATLGSGQAFSHTFDEPGTYEYYCALHPGMTGKVVVQYWGRW